MTSAPCVLNSNMIDLVDILDAQNRSIFGGLLQFTFLVQVLVDVYEDPNLLVTYGTAQLYKPHSVKQ